ncbi:hypothetical protein [Parabacteroides merdae]|uniref:hypothetical protein n=1 Tax=Parabacteroides merdae TaxID=46503 RepID=UPI0002DBCFCD|nr:hypothetical protein [Parabacteroides merdae]MCI7459908.1 hypothetical protein [Parabacteroides merdae]MDB8930177.1 hypothetical protein [Parabacteroides merdae]
MVLSKELIHDVALVGEHTFSSSEGTAGIKCGLQFWSGVLTHFGGLGRWLLGTIIPRQTNAWLFGHN